jgi:hypothetical protein
LLFPLFSGLAANTVNPASNFLVAVSGNDADHPFLEARVSLPVRVTGQTNVKLPQNQHSFPFCYLWGMDILVSG